MHTLTVLRAVRFLDLADCFLTVGSPLDAIHCTARAVRLDASLWSRSGTVLRAAAQACLPGDPPAPDDLHRIRRHLQKLEAATAADAEVRGSLAPPTSPADASGTKSDKALPLEVVDDLPRLEQMLDDRTEPAAERARRLIRELLEEVDPARRTASSAAPSPAQQLHGLAIRRVPEHRA